MEAKEVLALDMGSKRTGLARGSNVARLAQPLMSFPTTKTLATLEQYLQDHSVEAIVIGLPRNLKGEDTTQTSWVRQWAKKLNKQLNAPLYWQDEALTSEQARSVSREAGSDNVDEHAVAAAIILQDFLDAPEVARVPV